MSPREGIALSGLILLNAAIWSVGVPLFWISRDGRRKQRDFPRFILAAIFILVLYLVAFEPSPPRGWPIVEWLAILMMVNLVRNGVRVRFCDGCGATLNTPGEGEPRPMFCRGCGIMTERVRQTMGMRRIVERRCALCPSHPRRRPPLRFCPRCGHMLLLKTKIKDKADDFLS